MATNNIDERIDDIFISDPAIYLSTDNNGDTIMPEEAHQDIKSLLREVVLEVISVKPHNYQAESWQQGHEKAGYDSAIRCYEYKMLAELDNLLGNK